MSTAVVSRALTGSGAHAPRKIADDCGTRIHVSGDWAYFTCGGNSGVCAVPKAGGAPVTIARTTTPGLAWRGVAVDASYVYGQTFGLASAAAGTGKYQHQLVRAPRAGGAVEVLYSTTRNDSRSSTIRSSSRGFFALDDPGIRVPSGRTLTNSDMHTLTRFDFSSLPVPLPADRITQAMRSWPWESLQCGAPEAWSVVGEQVWFVFSDHGKPGCGLERSVGGAPLETVWAGSFGAFAVHGGEVFVLQIGDRTRLLSIPVR